ncbi:FecR family protein [Methylomonas sp. YC3]
MPAPSDKSAHTSLQDQAIAWLICLRDDRLDDAELEAFADWLSRDPLHAQAFTEAEALFSDMVLAGSLSSASESLQPASRHAAEKNAAADQIIDPALFIRGIPCEPSSSTFRQMPPPTGSGRMVIKSQADKPASRRPLARPRRPWFAAGLAVAAMWLLAISLIMPQQARLFSDYFSDYRTQTGEIREIQLSDGSRLLLNTNSAVSVAFTAAARRIILHHGQVQFTVAKDSRRPFDVVADDLTVRALGTVFEVYKTATGPTEVSVQEHAVAVSMAGQDSDVTVAQGQGLVYQPGLPLPHPRAVGAEQSAWRQHRLVINDRPLADLISELERYRLGRIFLADAALKNLRVTGVFSLDAPDEALSSVRKALALQETRIGPWVLLHR